MLRDHARHARSPPSETRAMGSRAALGQRLPNFLTRGARGVPVSSSRCLSLKELLTIMCSEWLGPNNWVFTPYQLGVRQAVRRPEPRDRTGHHHLHAPSRGVFRRYSLFIAINKPGFAGMGRPRKESQDHETVNCLKLVVCAASDRCHRFPLKCKILHRAPESLLPAVPRSWYKGTWVSIQTSQPRAKATSSRSRA